MTKRIGNAKHTLQKMNGPNRDRYGGAAPPEPSGLECVTGTLRQAIHEAVQQALPPSVTRETFKTVYRRPAPPPFVCPRCGAKSHNPNDVWHQYCGRCHEFFDEGSSSS
jgi:hypothetical protein